MKKLIFTGLLLAQSSFVYAAIPIISAQCTLNSNVDYVYYRTPSDADNSLYVDLNRKSLYSTRSALKPLLGY